MNFQTKIPLQKQSHHQIDYNSEMLLLGSCFSEHIGHKFQYYKFKTVVNPFGILFQPTAIENFIIKAINKSYYTEQDLDTINGLFYSFDAHSKFNTSNAEELLKQLNNALDLTLGKISTASHIVITLGTSWVYRHIASDQLVANCHKVPQKQFLKELLSVDEISESIEAVIGLIKTINPTVTFIFTVSPVRHLKDGFAENTLSKSHLISAIHKVAEPRKQLFYFPSYEIMMDELRDYRFYDSDMIHPNDVAIDYIWSCFADTWLNVTTKQIQEKVEVIQKGLSHRPFNQESESHQAFLKELHKKIESLQSDFPFMKF